MAYQYVFKRVEMKYMLTLSQKERIVEAMSPYMEPDKYGRTTIRNIYFDTPNYRLIRRSIEKPAYKEKLRVRSYKKAEKRGCVFVELKKKYKHVVYKRRISMHVGSAMDWLCGKTACPEDTQIAREIDYFLSFYGDIRPASFISYEREAYYSRTDDSLRITFDDNILCRFDDISLESDVYGTPILEAGKVLMEIKCSGGIPLWLAGLLSQEKIYKTSFSKYGTAYRELILSDMNKR